jgi:hypothetical protein
LFFVQPVAFIFIFIFSNEIASKFVIPDILTLLPRRPPASSVSPLNRNPPSDSAPSAQPEKRKKEPPKRATRKTPHLLKSPTLYIVISLPSSLAYPRVVIKPFDAPRLLAEQGLEGTLAVLGRLGGNAEHGDHREAAVLELSGLQLEDSLLGGRGAGEAWRREGEEGRGGGDGERVR